jgi:hypothetical protein
MAKEVLTVAKQRRTFTAEEKVSNFAAAFA